MKKEKTILLTYYIKNTDEQTKNAFDTVPYKSTELTISDDRLVKLIEADMKKCPFIRSCTVMEKNWSSVPEFHLIFTVTNPFYSEAPIPQEYKPVEAENRKIDDFVNKANMTTYEPSHQGFEIKLESEQKVIRLGSYFYDLKGVLICEATDEDCKKYYCEKYVTFPIVDEDWRVYDGDSIADGIEHLIVGKKGDTIPLAALKEAADYNAHEHDCTYEDQLLDLERHEITKSPFPTENSGILPKNYPTISLSVLTNFARNISEWIQTGAATTSPVVSSTSAMMMSCMNPMATITNPLYITKNSLPVSSMMFGDFPGSSTSRN